MKVDWMEASWPAPPNVRAVSTTRAGGFSAGRWTGLNLGTRCGDDPDHVRRNRALVDHLLPSPAHWVRQVHGTAVAKIDDLVGNDDEADAIVSFRPGQVCAILTADCLPVFFCNQAGDRVAIAHAGWRGLAGGVLASTVAALQEQPSRLLAWLGPAIGPGAYEVGHEVAEAFSSEFPNGFSARGDRFLMDLYTVARLKLRACGVDRVFGGGLCTFSEPDRFFSYRRDGETGRMAHFAWLAE
jgi:YfiH family protein